MGKQFTGSVDEALATSFKTLAIKKPIEKITIKEITDIAGVIRPTFYNHFQDKYELLEWIVRTELMEPCEKSFMSGDITDGIMGFLDTLSSEKKFYQSCARLTGQNSFSDILKQEIQGIILRHLGEESIKKRLWYDWLTPGRVADYFAESVTYAITEWIKSDMSIPPEEILEVFSFLVSHSVIELVVGAAMDIEGD